MNTAIEMTDILRRLRNARKVSGVSQNEIGSYFDRTGTWYSQLELGKMQLKIHVFLQICTLIDADPVEIIGGKPPVIERIARPPQIAPAQQQTNGVSDVEKRMMRMALDNLKNSATLLEELLEDA